MSASAALHGRHAPALAGHSPHILPLLPVLNRDAAGAALLRAPAVRSRCAVRSACAVVARDPPTAPLALKRHIGYAHACACGPYTPPPRAPPAAGVRACVRRVFSHARPWFEEAPAVRAAGRTSFALATQSPLLASPHSAIARPVRSHRPNALATHQRPRGGLARSRQLNARRFRSLVAGCRVAGSRRRCVESYSAWTPVRARRPAPQRRTPWQLVLWRDSALRGWSPCTPLYARTRARARARVQAAGALTRASRASRRVRLASLPSCLRPVGRGVLVEGWRGSVKPAQVPLLGP